MISTVPANSTPCCAGRTARMPAFWTIDASCRQGDPRRAVAVYTGADLQADGVGGDPLRLADPQQGRLPHG